MSDIGGYRYDVSSLSSSSSSPWVSSARLPRQRPIFTVSSPGALRDVRHSMCELSCHDCRAQFPIFEHGKPDFVSFYRGRCASRHHLRLLVPEHRQSHLRRLPFIKTMASVLEEVDHLPLFPVGHLHKQAPVFDAGPDSVRAGWPRFRSVLIDSECFHFWQALPPRSSPRCCAGPSAALAWQGFAPARMLIPALAGGPSQINTGSSPRRQHLALHFY